MPPAFLSFFPTKVFQVFSLEVYVLIMHPALEGKSAILQALYHKGLQVIHS